MLPLMPQPSHWHLKCPTRSSIRYRPRRSQHLPRHTALRLPRVFHITTLSHPRVGRWYQLSGKQRPSRPRRISGDYLGGSDRDWKGRAEGTELEGRAEKAREKTEETVVHLWRRRESVNDRRTQRERPRSERAGRERERPQRGMRRPLMGIRMAKKTQRRK